MPDETTQNERETMKVTKDYLRMTPAMFGATPDFSYRFALSVAESVLRRDNVAEPRIWAAIAAKRRWLAGDATDAELADAHDDAYAVAVQSNGLIACAAADRDPWRAAESVIAHAITSAHLRSISRCRRWQTGGVEAEAAMAHEHARILDMMVEMLDEDAGITS